LRCGGREGGREGRNGKEEACTAMKAAGSVWLNISLLLCLYVVESLTFFSFSSSSTFRSLILAAAAAFPFSFIIAGRGQEFCSRLLSPLFLNLSFCIGSLYSCDQEEDEEDEEEEGEEEEDEEDEKGTLPKRTAASRTVCLIPSMSSAAPS